MENKFKNKTDFDLQPVSKGRDQFAVICLLNSCDCDCDRGKERRGRKTKERKKEGGIDRGDNLIQIYVTWQCEYV